MRKSATGFMAVVCAEYAATSKPCDNAAEVRLGGRRANASGNRLRRIRCGATNGLARRILRILTGVEAAGRPGLYISRVAIGAQAQCRGGA